MGADFFPGGLNASKIAIPQNGSRGGDTCSLEPFLVAQSKKNFVRAYVPSNWNSIAVWKNIQIFP